MFKLPVKISVYGGTVRTIEDSIYLIDISKLISAKLRYNMKKGISEQEFKENYTGCQIFMLDDTKNKVLTGDEVIVTGVYRHSAKTISDCTYELVE